jgi:hypothetical protein
MVVKYSKWPQNIPTFSIPMTKQITYTKIVSLGMKIHHLATLPESATDFATHGYGPLTTMTMFESCFEKGQIKC